MIIFLVLTLLTLGSSADITLTLSSGSTSKIVPILQSCSCQLAVFPVYGYIYNVTVDVLTVKKY